MYSKIVPVSSIAPEGWGPKEGGNATSPLHSRGSPKEGEQNQKPKPRPGVTMMHHATKRGFKDCPGFLNSTGRLGPKRGRKCYVTPAFSGVPKRRGTKSENKTYARGHHDAPRDKACIQRLSRFPQYHRKVGAQKRAEMLRHPCILGGPQKKGNKIRSQNLGQGSP